MSSVQVLLQQLWTNMNHTFYRRTASQLPPILYYLISPVANLYFYYHYFDDFSDAKLRQWPLMGSILWPSMIVSIYLLVVYHGYNWLKNGENESSPIQRSVLKAWSHQQNSVHGQKTHIGHHHHHHGKSHRKEMSLAQRPLFSMLVVAYNAGMAALNAWIAFELLYCAWKSKYNFLCQLVYTGTDDPYENRIARAIWWYFASKGIELLDTMLILIKRKINQLTFLHIYHHSTMFLVWWVGAKFVPGGSAVTGALVNCIVHVLMYSYYALASLGPRLHPYLWWKKYLTIIQLIQFTLGVTLGLNSILTGCPFTRWMQYVFVCYAFSFLILFGNFYRKTYNQSLASFNQNGEPPNQPNKIDRSIINNQLQSSNLETSNTLHRRNPKKIKPSQRKNRQSNSNNDPNHF